MGYPFGYVDDIDFYGEELAAELWGFADEDCYEPNSLYIGDCDRQNYSENQMTNYNASDTHEDGSCDKAVQMEESEIKTPIRDYSYLIKKLSVPDEEEYFVQEDDEDKKITNNLYYVYAVDPLPDFRNREYLSAWVGIDIRTGEFYRVDDYEAVCGFCTTGGTEVNKIDLNEFQRLTDNKYPDMTRENSLDYVPEEYYKKHEKKQLPELPEKYLSPELFTNHLQYDVSYIKVANIQRYGTTKVELVQYSNGYRAFLHYYSENQNGYRISRHLNKDEVNYILQTLPEVAPENGSGVQGANWGMSLYGDDWMNTLCVLTNGDYFYFADNENVLKLYNRLEDATSCIFVSEEQKNKEGD